MKSGDWNVASQLYYLAEKEKPFDFNDESQYWDIYKVAELYAFVEHPDRLRGHDHMIKLAENGFRRAYEFLKENNCPYYEKNIAGYEIRDMIYKLTLMGRIAYDNLLVDNINVEEKYTNKDIKAIERQAFCVATGYERSMWEDEDFWYQNKYDDARKYYEKMDRDYPSTRLGLLRIDEAKLYITANVAKKKGEEIDLVKRGRDLTKIAAGYLRVADMKEGKTEEVIGKLRAIELLQMKSERCPAVLSGNVFEKDNVSAIKGKMLPFSRNSKNLLNLKIVAMNLFEYGEGDVYSWEKLKDNLYCCKYFDFLYDIPAEYDGDVLENMSFDTRCLCAFIVDELGQKISRETLNKALLYLYETEGKLHKKYMGYVTDECEKIAAKETDGAKKARADYYLFRIYSGKENVKKDIEKSLTHLISAAKGGCADAQYEAAILAKKGKLKKFGVEKGEYAELLRLAADGGNEKAKKKIK